MTVASVILDLVRGVIAEISGKKSDLSAESVARAIADKVKESIAATIALELRQAQALLGFTLASHELAAVATELLQKLYDAEKGGGMLGKLLDGADVETMPPDWKPEP